MDSDFVAPFVSGSQNTSMAIQESFPKVEIVTSNSTKHGGNFSVDEDNLLVSAWLNISMDVVQGLPQTPSSLDQVGSNDEDTTVVERPIGRKAERAKRKRTDGGKGFEDYLAKKLQYIQASHEQDKEALRIKADRVRVDAQRADIEKEKLHLETIREAKRDDMKMI
ncbi:hypothetical protein SO802_031332 [Lithocarpus litseifolius]|uniref:No apical meristem-associated C-terminal domain-containing protein n=1 Tax=Lithocarpus litseifolius TaxID=425828 RepID=A0AAW2BM22_9ROSI